MIPMVQRDPKNVRQAHFTHVMTDQIKIDQFFREPDSDDWHSHHETKPSLWVINTVDVATENEIHCHLQQILDIK